MDNWIPTKSSKGFDPSEPDEGIFLVPEGYRYVGHRERDDGNIDVLLVHHLHGQGISVFNRPSDNLYNFGQFWRPIRNPRTLN